MTSDERAALGERLKALREERGMTLDDLERQTGVSKGYLSQLERGEKTNPGVKLVERVADGLGVGVSELIDGPRSYVETPARVPAGLKELLQRAAEAGAPLPDEDVHMLQSVQYRGRRPRSAEDWSLLYDFIKRIVR